MRGLLILVAVMGVLIVAGVAIIGVTVAHRLTHTAALPGTPSAIVLDEPAGTQITGIAGVGDRLAVALRGGGPDRVVVVGGANTQPLGTIRLAR